MSETVTFSHHWQRSTTATSATATLRVKSGGHRAYRDGILALSASEHLLAQAEELLRDLYGRSQRGLEGGVGRFLYTAVCVVIAHGRSPRSVVMVSAAAVIVPATLRG
ncbi:hypothetical protein [Rathayibacter sp. VKM Ac-2857]|uniref:hypothetical protein n=1 Tax=Rathayibacter sp. VKM Ac-2857 TaxID=2739020 RepID=UPI00156730F0|nr:hypothetical protein [Rathayibacter sp. VKM Ac-2857]NQX17244.1 hypothetical protein [Rathayibacter sp. VKM Ac-2857]